MSVEFQAVPVDRAVEIMRTWTFHRWPMTVDEAVGVYTGLGFAPLPDDRTFFTSDMSPQEADSFLLVDDDTFVFRLNAAVIAPCKLANVKFYDGAKCIKDKKELENFTKSYDKEIKKIFRPERNYYVLTLKNLGDRWLCEISDESKILNKTLVKHGLAAATSKEYQKIKIKEDWVKKNHSQIYECLTDKKLEEPKKKSKKAENNATKNAQTEQDSLGSQPTQTQPQTPPSMPMESQGNGPVNLKELGIEFGKDFGEK